MAERRMFAKTIIDSDAFLDMPLSAQALYFHLSMRADDDGFVNNPKKIQRMVGASDDDCKLLVMKRFILTFESGVIVIKHWKIHNYIQKDRYKETVYIKEKSTLSLNENNAYTECTHNVYTLETQDSIDKISIDKDKKENIKKDKEKDIYKYIKEKECKEKDTTPFDTFISKYSINVDNYSAMITEMDFNLLDKAFSESNWLCDNYVSLSRICKDYKKIVGGYYKDFVKPKEEKPDHLTDAEFLILKGFSKEWVMSLSEEERAEKRKKWE